jgi:predicted RNA binding protein YcfA (HicA-like mRNA interferase family)
VSPVAPAFKALKARKMRTLLERELGYYVASNKGGSHRKYRHETRPPVTLAFHDGDEIGPALVRDILVKQVGLTMDEAKEVMRRV